MQGSQITATLKGLTMLHQKGLDHLLPKELYL
jgi:hypothetical protein